MTSWAGRRRAVRSRGAGSASWPIAMAPMGSWSSGTPKAARNGPTAVVTDGAAAAPASGQKRSSSVPVSTRKAWPCENPADGPRTALRKIRVQAFRHDRLVAELAHHVPAPHDVGEVHDGGAC